MIFKTIKCARQSDWLAPSLSRVSSNFCQMHCLSLHCGSTWGAITFGIRRNTFTGENEVFMAMSSDLSSVVQLSHSISWILFLHWMLGSVQPGNLIYRMVVTHTDNGLVILEQIIPWVPSQANLCNSLTPNYALCLTQAALERVLPRATYKISISFILFCCQKYIIEKIYMNKT